MFDTISFEPGEVIYNDFEINPDVPIEYQIDSLKEDLFQVNYFDKYLIDVGWYPEFNANGNFRTVVVKDFNWEKPVFQKLSNDIYELTHIMEECVSFVSQLLQD